MRMTLTVEDAGGPAPELSGAAGPAVSADTALTAAEDAGAAPGEADAGAGAGPAAAAGRPADAGTGDGGEAPGWLVALLDGLGAAAGDGSGREAGTDAGAAPHA